METQKLNRKQRRALVFGTPEQRKEIQKIEPRKPFYVQEKDGLITIPYVGPYEDILRYVKRDLPEHYFVSNFEPVQTGTAKDPTGYTQMAVKWFFNGLQVFTPIFKSNLVSETADGFTSSDPAFVKQSFLFYLSAVMQEFGLSHEEKMAFIAYLCDTCCTEIFWMES